MLLGSIILAMSTDILTFVLGLELQSYSVYILAGSTRSIESPEEPSAFTGLKYFLLGAMSSALVFMGLGLLYLFSGSTSLSTNFSLAASLDSDILYCYLGYSLVYAGLLWKIAAAPVHAWSVDVYDALPNRIAAIVSLIPKVAIITILARLTMSIMSCTSITGILNINSTVICLSLIIGAVGGLYQSRIKRLLAYSSILNMGFILMVVNSCSYYQSQYVISMYLLQYVLATGAIWLCINSIRTSDLTLISQLQGLGNIQGKLSNCQCLAISLTILVLSVAGIPPMIGFFAKFEVIYLAISSNSLYLALIAIIASLISTVYYLRIVKNIWFVKSISYITNETQVNYRKDLFNRSTVKGNEVTGLNTGIAISISFITLFILTFTLQYPILYTFIV
jgi:proton-translocating NADH-quinone oxidoreductase chain N